jgi:hypothetical protein
MAAQPNGVYAIAVFGTSAAPSRDCVNEPNWVTGTRRFLAPLVFPTLVQSNRSHGNFTVWLRRGLLCGKRFQSTIITSPQTRFSTPFRWMHRKLYSGCTFTRVGARLAGAGRSTGTKPSRLLLHDSFPRRRKRPALQPEKKLWRDLKAARSMIHTSQSPRPTQAISNIYPDEETVRPVKHIPHNADDNIPWHVWTAKSIPKMD